MDEKEMLNKLKSVQNEKRFNHTLGVTSEAVRLAKKYGVDQEKAKITGLLHDCAKNFDKDKYFDYCKEYGVDLDEYAQQESALIHAFLGAAVAQKDYGVTDKEILDAIYYHTVLRSNMSMLEKIIYVADIIEPNRTMPNIKEIRRLADIDLDRAVLYAIECSIRYVIDKGQLLHPLSIDARNFLIRSGVKGCD